MCLEYASARGKSKKKFVVADGENHAVIFTPASQFSQLRAAQAGKKIWEKTDYTSTLGRTRKAMEELAPDVDPAALRKAKESKGLITAATVRARVYQMLTRRDAARRELLG